MMILCFGLYFRRGGGGGVHYNEKIILDVHNEMINTTAAVH